jgi:hypothetical protein
VPAPQTGIALIDTGATMTCVHEPILKLLTLNPIGAVTSGTANGPVQQSLYPASLHFTALGFGIELDQVAGVDLAGQTVPLNPPQNVVALIGRNVLSRCIFIYNGPGGFWTLAM